MMQLQRSTLFSDGKQLALSSFSDERMYLLPSFVVTNFELQTHYAEYMMMGGFSPNHLPTGHTCTIEIQSTGSCTSIPLEEGMKLFRSVDSMSVSDLLAAAYQKMEARSES
jgi:hypothetical protein